MSVREGVRAALAADWAAIPALAGVRVLATESALDTPSRPTVNLKAQTIAKEPAAPSSGARRVGLLLTVISPKNDLDKAQDELDELVEAILDYLDGKILYTEATQVAVPPSLIGYDIPLTILAPKE